MIRHSNTENKYTERKLCKHSTIPQDCSRGMQYHKTVVEVCGTKNDTQALFLVDVRRDKTTIRKKKNILRINAPIFRHHCLCLICIISCNTVGILSMRHSNSAPKLTIQGVNFLILRQLTHRYILMLRL